MKIKGTITMVNDTVQVTKEFQRRNFVIEHNDRGHSEYISLELLQDHCKLIDRFKEGDNVVVDFNLKGRKWKNVEGVDKYFNTLQAWKISTSVEKDD